MPWGYQPGLDKAHCYVLVENSRPFVSLCNELDSFKIYPVKGEHPDHMNICLKCLLEFIQKGEAKQ